MWWIIGGSAVIGIGLGYLVLSRTNWYRIRLYAVNIKKVFDKHKVQEKAEAVQQLGQNPNPVLVKKPLSDLIGAYKGLIAELEAIKAPKQAQDVHESTLAMHRESLQLYQMAAIGGFRQKSLMDKQKKLMQMEKGLTAKMEKLYGPMKKPEKKK